MDVDNIIKPILDQLKQLVYLDDKQVTRIIAQKIDLLQSEIFLPVASSILTLALRSKDDFLHILVQWE